MKKIITFIGIFIILISSVNAIGIKWYQEQQGMLENSETCIPYGVYNPSGKDIRAKVQVDSGLLDIVTGLETESKIIKAGTPSKNAENVDICFTIGTLYEKNCLIGNFLCESLCEEEIEEYVGQVIMSEAPAGGDGAGSKTSIAASAPLKITVACDKYDRNWIPVYLVIITILLIILWLLWRSKPKKSKRRKKKKR